jgi:hypothetical protein
MTGSDEDLRRGRRPSAEDRGRSSKGRVLDCWTIGGGGGSGNALCGLHHARGDEKHEFLGLASKQWSVVSPGLA